MTPDPLDVLRIPIVPIDPRPEFADSLLRRLAAGPESIHAAVARATVRYFVDDLGEAIAFYCQRLDFEMEMSQLPSFAMLYRGDLRLLLSVPYAAHALPDGTLPEPGGWNRMALEVANLAGTAESLREMGTRLRTGIVTGIGARHILIEDPAGNLVEVFEQIAGYRERPRAST